jgi:general secretion pathway protein L
MNQPYVFLPPQAVAGADPELPVRLVTGGRSRETVFSQALAGLVTPWTLVLPVEAVTACAVVLPTQKARWLRQALPFAVEELLAEDVELFHLAVGEPLGEGRHRVFAVRRDWLDAWLSLCGEARPAHMRVDADLLPAAATGLAALDGRWLLGGAAATRLALHAEDWSQVADACPAPRRAYVNELSAPPQGMDEVVLLDDVHAWLAEVPRGCDLAQGEYAIRHGGEGWLRWRPVLAIVGLWLLLQWGFNLVQSWQLQRSGDAYASASEALYRQLFPDDQRLINLRAQFDQHLAEGGEAQGRLLGLLGRASEALADGGAQVRVQSLDFSESRGDVALQLQAPGFEALEQLRERLISAGLAVDLGSASREDDGVSARMVIGG